MDREKWTKANTIQSRIKMLEDKRDALKNSWKAYSTNTKGYDAKERLSKFITKLTDSFGGERVIDNIVDNLCKLYDEGIAKLQKQFEEL